MSAGRPNAPIVVKLGGGLATLPDALDRAVTCVARLAHRWPVVVVPGGGPLADAVRWLDQVTGLSDEAAHWMAILAMDQYGHLLAERIPDAELVEEPGRIGAVLAEGRVAVLAPYRWMRSADVLPHSWDATSDSVAAFVAGGLDARHLVLVKPVGGDPDRLVDPCFQLVRPAGLACTVIEWQRLDELPARLEAPSPSA